MGFGFGHLRLSSRAFWALTPRELAAAARHGRDAMGEPPDRAAFNVLMTRFPDFT